MKSTIIFFLGLLFFAAWNWWLLQRAILQNASGNTLKIGRIALAIFMLLLYLGIIPVVKNLSLDSLAAQRFLKLFYSVQVLGLWFGFTGLFLTGWNLVSRTSWHLAPRPTALVCIGIALLAAIIGYVQTGSPKLKRYDISLSGVPTETDGYKILLLSDLHLIQLYRTSVLDAVAQAIDAEKPDIILHSGDFLDSPRHGELTALLQKIAAWNAPDGKYAVFGNHDGYAGWRDSLEVHQQAGFALLSGRTQTAAAFPRPWLHLAGMDDSWIWMKPHFPAKAADGDEILDRKAAYARSCEQIPPPVPNACNLLLCHGPDMADVMPEGYDAMLSGHTHGGQLFPFNFVLFFTCKYPTSAWSALKNGGRLYICRGTGTWGPPFRLFVPPEMTLITLHHE